MVSRRDHLLNAVGSLLVPLASLMTAPLLARALGPTDRGTFTAEQSLILAASSLVALGVSDAAAAQWNSLRRRQQWTISGFNLCASFLFAVAGGLYIALTVSPPFKQLILCLIAAAVFAAALHARGVALANADIKFVAIEKFVTVFSRLIITLVAFMGGVLSLEVAVVSLLLPQALGLIFLLFRMRSYTRDDLDASERQNIRWSSLGWTVLAGSGGVFLVNGVPLFAVGIIGPRELGYFSICVLIAEVFTMVAKPFRDASFTLTARASPQLVRRQLLLGLTTLTGLAVFGATVLWFAVPFVFGPDFAPAIPACYVILAGGVFKGWGFHLSALLTTYGLSRLRALSNYFSFGVNICLLTVLASAGAVGASIACSVAYAIMAVWGAVGLRRRLKHFPASMN